MHQIQKDKFHVISPEAFSPKPLNEVQKRLQAILDYWGPNGEGHYCGRCSPDGKRGCFVTVSMNRCGAGYEIQLRLNAIARQAAREMGFVDAATCSDSGFKNARKMVLRAIALAGEQ